MTSMLLARILGIKRKDIVLVKLFILTVLYVVTLRFFPVLFVLLVIFWVVSIYAYWTEKNRTADVVDSFEDDNLFYRYGTRIHSENYPIRLIRNNLLTSKDDLIDELRRYLVQSISTDIDYDIKNGTHKTDTIEVYDRYFKNDLRSFTRFAYTGLRGGEVNHFMLVEHIGNYLIVHLDSYFKGVPHWYDKAYFVMSSPYKIWFWFIPWLRNDYSVLTKLSLYLDNSFEFYDLLSYYITSEQIILGALREFLRERDLLTEELDAKISYQMVVNQNFKGNNTVISGSHNKILGSIMQTVR